MVLSGETIFCIGRGYGVLPGAIAQVNGLSAPFTVFPGQALKIPAAQWSDILPGPVCAPQFQSPYPGLPVPTPTVEATATPAGPPLAVTINILCIGNCGGRDGDYVLRIYVDASGGAAPYTFNPGKEYDVTFRHCTTGSGTATVTSADGQTASNTWTFVDVNCPPTP